MDLVKDIVKQLITSTYRPGMKKHVDAVRERYTLPAAYPIKKNMVMVNALEISMLYESLSGRFMTPEQIHIEMLKRYELQHNRWNYIRLDLSPEYQTRFNELVPVYFFQAGEVSRLFGYSPKQKTSFTL